jgi:hypothetical protein
MGNQYLDAIWLIPIGGLTALIWLVFRLGIEVGRDQVRQEIKAARTRVVKQRTAANLPTNVTPIRNTK